MTEPIHALIVGAIAIAAILALQAFNAWCDRHWDQPDD